MHRAAIVPHHEVVVLPDVAVDEARLPRERDQLVVTQILLAAEHQHAMPVGRGHDRGVAILGLTRCRTGGHISAANESAL